MKSLFRDASREVNQPDEEEHEDAGRNDDNPKENEDAPLNPQVRRDVSAVHSRVVTR